MEYQVHIAYITSKFSSILGECETSSTGLLYAPLSLIRVLDSELNALQHKESHKWPPHTEISFLDARLNLYRYALGQGIDESPGTFQTTRPDTEFTTLGSVAAIQLLSVASAFPDELSKSTFHTFRCVSYAVFFLLRISGTAENTIDKTAVRNSISQTSTLMKNISRTDRDQWSRMCRIIENMTDYDEWDKETPLTGRARSFMS
ncbi:hypothetical protein EG329_008503 [Mollisiaceae sp. DMI_Dod_QoI]|nr:hypothetical protein EG329_008503 [Helotiales sp. DMI_Dod_QoI]